MPQHSSKTSVEGDNDKARMTNDKGPGNKLQNSKHQAPSSKTDLRGVCPCIRFWALVFEFLELLWSLGFGGWSLGFRSAALNNTTEMRTPRKLPFKPPWRSGC